MLPKAITKKRHYKETMLLVAMLGMSILFVSMTLLYLVRKDTAGWVHFILPKPFSFSTFFILFSSYTLYVANISFKKEEFFTYRYMIGTTFVLGLLFLFCQYLGYLQLQQKGLFLAKSSSVAFLYIICVLHLLHLLAAIIALCIVFWQAIRKIEYVDAYVYSVNPPNQRRLALTTLFWHFLGGLWLYLYCFFYLQH